MPGPCRNISNVALERFFACNESHSVRRKKVFLVGFSIRQYACALHADGDEWADTLYNCTTNTQIGDRFRNTNEYDGQEIL